MYIGDIHWKHINLEISFAFGNKKCILETCIGYWKHKMDIGNITFVWKHTYIGNIERNVIERVARKVYDHGLK